MRAFQREDHLVRGFHGRPVECHLGAVAVKRVAGTGLNIRYET